MLGSPVKPDQPGMPAGALGPDPIHISDERWHLGDIAGVARAAQSYDAGHLAEVVGQVSEHDVTERLAGAAVEAVELRKGLLDLESRFSTGHSLRVIPSSSGYEAWQATSRNRQFIAVGGGELAIFGD